jgi:hypothetical protein
MSVSAAPEQMCLPRSMGNYTMYAGTRIPPAEPHRLACGFSQHNWVACIQLPWCRIGILNGHSFKTETAAMKKLRDFIRKNSKQLKEFAIICNKYRDLVQAFQIGKKDLKNRLIDKKDFNGHVQELCEYLNTHVWFAMGSYMSKDRILSELRGIYDRELPELEEK